MEKKKRRWGDRKDGVLLRQVLNVIDELDLSDYEGFFLFLPELSVLLLMASLLSLALRLRPAGKEAKP